VSSHRLPEGMALAGFQAEQIGFIVKRQQVVIVNDLYS
jgi:hypothetical protein